MTEMNHYLEQERKIAELQKRVTSLESLCFQSKPVLNLEEASIYLGISRSMLYKMTHAGKIDFYKVDIDKERELAETFGIQSIPTFLFIPMSGKPTAQTGAMQKADFEALIKSVILK